MIKSEKKYSCILWGGYAHGNTGDEICLAAALERKQREFKGDVAILSHLPEFTSQIFPGVAVIRYDPKWSRMRKRFIRACQSLATRSGLAYFLRNGRFDSAPEWIRCLADAKQLYLAGGGYLTDLFWMGFILQPIQYALKMKVPVISAPVGIGPFKSPSNADEAMTALRQIKLTVRDQVSMDFCRAHGIDASLAPDDAFAFVKNLSPLLSAKLPSARPRKIGVCIFKQYNQDANNNLTGWWTACLRGLKAQHPEHKIEGFCFHTSLQDEFQEMTRLFSQAGLPPENVLAPTADFRKAAEAIHDYDFVISARFHAIITANVFNIPNIAIAASDYYQAKINAARLGFENTCTLINPASQRPEDLLNICQSKLAGSGKC